MIEQRDLELSEPEMELDHGSQHWLGPLVAHSRRLIFWPIVAGSVAVGATFLVRPTFTAQTVFLPPQQQPSAAASVVASLGTLANFAGGSLGTRTPADQYTSLLRSATIGDRVVKKFDLMRVYDAEYGVDARRELWEKSRFFVGKKDGLITIEVDDTDPQRAAAMANTFVDELRRLTSSLALTEAQQRRVFFDLRLRETREQLTLAQQRLEASGFSASALRAEPKAAAESYARLKAEVTAAEVRVQAMRRSLDDSTPEVSTQLATLAALRSQLKRIEQATVPAGPDADYISRLREFKYYEALFELYAKQFELARLDEARDGAMFQVIDVATPPERKSWPKRAWVGVGVAASAFLLMIGYLIVASTLRAGALQAPMPPRSASPGRRD